MLAISRAILTDCLWLQCQSDPASELLLQTIEQWFVTVAPVNAPGGDSPLGPRARRQIGQVGSLASPGAQARGQRQQSAQAQAQAVRDVQAEEEAQMAAAIEASTAMAQGVGGEGFRSSGVVQQPAMPQQQPAAVGPDPAAAAAAAAAEEEAEMLQAIQMSLGQPMTAAAPAPLPPPAAAELSSIAGFRPTEQQGAAAP